MTAKDALHLLIGRVIPFGDMKEAQALGIALEALEEKVAREAEKPKAPPHPSLLEMAGEVETLLELHRLDPIHEPILKAAASVLRKLDEWMKLYELNSNLWMKKSMIGDLRHHLGLDP